MAIERRFEVGDRAIAWFRDGSFTGQEVKIHAVYKFNYAVEIPSSNGTFLKAAFRDELMPIDGGGYVPPAPTPPADALTALWQSTAALYAAFDIDVTKLKEQTQRYLNEEHFEMQQAATAYHFCAADLDYEERQEAREELRNEFGDLLFTMFGVALANGLTLEDIRDGMYAVKAKNDRKRPENGFAFVNGKIREVQS